MTKSIVIIWQAGAVATLAYLLSFNQYVYTWWNWIITVPCDLFLAEIWPVYWALFHWIF